MARDLRAGLLNWGEVRQCKTRRKRTERQVERERHTEILSIPLCVESVERGCEGSFEWRVRGWLQGFRHREHRRQRTAGEPSSRHFAAPELSQRKRMVRFRKSVRKKKNTAGEREEQEERERDQLGASVEVSVGGGKVSGLANGVNLKDAQRSE